MAISHKSSGAVASSSGSITGTYAIGDLIIIGVYNDASNTIPTVVNGWAVTGSSAGGGNALLVAWKYAQSTSETFGTWTNATFLSWNIYSGSAGLILPGRSSFSSGTSGSGGTITFGSLVVASGSATERWINTIVGHKSNNTDIETAPSGFTARSNVAGGSTGEIATHDSSANTTSTSVSPITLSTGTSASWRSSAIELIEGGWLPSSGSSARPVHPLFQNVIG